jgi:hypothetical protein
MLNKSRQPPPEFGPGVGLGRRQESSAPDPALDITLCHLPASVASLRAASFLAVYLFAVRQNAYTTLST